MSFYHPNGLIPSWEFAKKFAGDGGRVATLPDIVAARICDDKLEGFAWDNYFTTASAEYFGYSKKGNLILIVAHGIGPMSTIEGVKKAYSFQYNDKNCDNRGGRISQEEFCKLESGQYGEVSIIDLEALKKRYKYPFLEQLTGMDVSHEELMRARLGKKYLDYIRICLRFSEEAKIDLTEYPANIITMSDASNCPYLFQVLETNPGLAVCHLLSVGSPLVTHHQNSFDGQYITSLIHDVSCHEWSNGARFVGIKADAGSQSINPGTNDLDWCLEEKWKSLVTTREAPKNEKLGVRRLMDYGEYCFTEVPKVGERMDTGKPEFFVRLKKKVGPVVFFRTTIGGYHGFVKYGLNEIQVICPRQANAYEIISDWQSIQKNKRLKWHEAIIQFYKADIVTSEVYPDKDKILQNYEDTMRVLKIAY